MPQTASAQPALNITLPAGSPDQHAAWLLATIGQPPLAPADAKWLDAGNAIVHFSFLGAAGLPGATAEDKTATKLAAVTLARVEKALAVAHARMPAIFDHARALNIEVPSWVPRVVTAPKALRHEIDRVLLAEEEMRGKWPATAAALPPPRMPGWSETDAGPNNFLSRADRPFRSVLPLAVALSLILDAMGQALSKDDRAQIVWPKAGLVHLQAPEGENSRRQLRPSFRDLVRMPKLVPPVLALAEALTPAVALALQGKRQRKVTFVSLRLPGR